MTARNRTAKPSLGKDESGVSTVLGAILVFGLFVATLATVQVRFVPVWDRDREAALMADVRGELAALKADLDRQADNRTGVPVTAPVTLARPVGFRFASGGTPPAGLAFAPAPDWAGVHLASPQLRLLRQDGRALQGAAETWISVVSGGSLTSVAGVDHLRLRIATPAAWGTGDSVTLTLLGPGNAYAGKIVVRNIDHGSTYSLEFQTYAATSPTAPVSIVQESFAKSHPPPHQYVDLLRSELAFIDVLAAAPKPFTLQFTRQTMAADYAASYLVQGPGGTTPVGNPGVPLPAYAFHLPSGALQYQSRNQRFVEQAFTLEHGALILRQPDGAVMAVPPQMRAHLAAGQLNLAWTLPALDGASAAVGGPSTGSVTLTPLRARADLVGTAAQLTVTLSTRHPEVWASFWDATLTEAGLSGTGAQPQFTITTNATAATLSLYGLQSDPASALDDIVLTLKATAIGARVQSAASG